MNKSKTFLLLAILAAMVAILAGFASQNWRPRISLSFLGMNSVPLPLAIWVLLAVLAGVITAVTIWSLFALSNYLTLQEATYYKEKEVVEVPVERGPRPVRKTEVPPMTAVRETEVPPTTAVRETEVPLEGGGSFESSESGESGESGDRSGTRGFFNLKKGSPGSSGDRNVDDWNERPSREEDWGGEGSPVAKNQEPSVETNPRNYEADQKPKTESWSGSVYSYGYKDSDRSGVGQSESVYDADYRIITPPPKSQSPQTSDPPDN